LINNVSQQKLVLKTAEELKGIIKMPEWAKFVKTGSHRETMPKNLDWWYVRAASILRVVNVLGPVGVNKLKTRYGGRKNRGMKPDAFQEASGKVIRVILQQLQKAELIKEHTIGTRKGRVSTPKGMSLLEKCARIVSVEETTKPKVAKKIDISEDKPKVAPKPKYEKKKSETVDESKVEKSKEDGE
jgi:small subunit ribosomal protein S19e